MTPQIDVRHNAGAVMLELDKFAANVRDGAMVRALNRTLTTVRLEAGRQIQPDTGLPVMQVRKQIRFTRASKLTLKALLRFSNSRVRLTRFGAQQTPAGIRFQGKGPKFVIAKPTWGAKEVEIPLSELAHAFEAASRQAKVQNVWKREGKERYPLLLLLGPSLSDVFEKSALDKPMKDVAQRRFAEVLVQELRFVQMKAKP